MLRHALGYLAYLSIRSAFSPDTVVGNMYIVEVTLPQRTPVQNRSPVLTVVYGHPGGLVGPTSPYY